MSKMHDNAEMHDNAAMFDNATMLGYAKMYGSAIMQGNAVLSQKQHVGRNGTVVVADLSKNLAESIRCQTGLIPFNDKVIAYAQVLKDEKDSYKVGEEINQDIRCSNGGHFNTVIDPLESTFLILEVKLKNIIDVQRGEIMCNVAKVLDTYDIEV